MKVLLIIIGIVLIAIFTGTWIFNGGAWIFDLFAKGFKFMAKIFDFFGWNKGIV